MSSPSSCNIRNTGRRAAPFTEVEFELPLEAMFVDVTEPGRREGRCPPTGDCRDRRSAGRRRSSVQHFAGRPARRWRPLAHAASESAIRACRRRVLRRRRAPSWSIRVVANTGVKCLAASVSIRASLAADPASCCCIPILRVLTGSRKEIERAGADDRDRRGLPVDFRGDGLGTTGGAIQAHTAIILHRFSIRALRIETSPSSTSTSSPPSRRQRYTTTYEPLLAMRYDANGREVIGTGYSTGFTPPDRPRCSSTVQRIRAIQDRRAGAVLVRP